MHTHQGCHKETAWRTYAFTGKDTSSGVIGWSFCRWGLHAEIDLLNKLSKGDIKKRKNIKITIARYKKTSSGDVIFSLALPCLHCRKTIQIFQKKWHVNFLIRYSKDDGTFTRFAYEKNIPQSRLSSGNLVKCLSFKNTTKGKNEEIRKRFRTQKRLLADFFVKECK